MDDFEERLWRRKDEAKVPIGKKYPGLVLTLYIVAAAVIAGGVLYALFLWG